MNGLLKERHDNLPHGLAQIMMHSLSEFSAGLLSASCCAKEPQLPVHLFLDGDSVGADALREVPIAIRRAPAPHDLADLAESLC